MQATQYMPFLPSDTLVFANRLKAAGLDPKIAEAQAELHASVFSEFAANHLASRKDLQDVKFELKADVSELRAEFSGLRAEFSELKTELRADINQIKSDMHNLRNDIIVKLGSVVVACSAILGTLLVIFSKTH